MKKILLFFAVLTIAVNAMCQIKVTNSGDVGIGNTNPLHKLDVHGTFRINAWTGMLDDWTGNCGAICLYPTND